MDGVPSLHGSNEKEYIHQSSLETSFTEKTTGYGPTGGTSNRRRRCKGGRRSTRLASGESLLPGLCDDAALQCLARVSRSDYPKLACLNSRFNSVVRSGVLYEVRRRMGIVENWVFLFCDPRGWDAFDPGRRRWMRLPKMPCDECFNHADKESLAVGSDLLVLGRECMDFAIWKYSMVHMIWERCDPMNSPRCLFGSGSHGTIGIFAGGSDRSGRVLTSAELYDSATGKWEMLPDMHTPRRLSSGFFMDGRFCVIGGMSGPTVSLTCGEELDLGARRWKKIEGMYPMANRAAQAPPLVAVVDNQLYTVEHSSNRVMKYVKEKNTWVIVGRLPMRADTSNGWGLGFKACGEDVLVVGGQRGPDGEGIVMSTWRPAGGEGDGGGGGRMLDWKVVGVTERVGVFVYNCAVMGC